MFKKYLSLNLFVLALFIADRIIKYWFLKSPTLKIGGDFLFNLHLETNTGVAFGLRINQVVLPIVIILIILVLISFLMRAYQRQSLFDILSFSLIITGAASNLLDRLRYGFVIDYIDVPWFTVFNLADTMISIGVALLVIDVFFKKEKKQLKSTTLS